MRNRKIAFVCHFSNEKIRERMHLKKWMLRNSFYRIISHPLRNHKDCDVWVSDFIEEFEKDNNHDYYIISTHRGMKKKKETFCINGINYIMLRSDGNLIQDLIESKFHLKQKNNYQRERGQLLKTVDEVDPSLVVVCGAEMPEYSSVCLDIKDKPLFLILQTVLNNPDLISLSNEGMGYRALLELSIFKSVKYFGTSIKKYYDIYTKYNPASICLKTYFPSHCPTKYDVEKIYDFGYYGRATLNKGIVDLVKAFALVVKHHPSASLNIVSSFDSEISRIIYQIIEENGLNDNIVITEPFESMNDLFRQVQKSRCMVLPGITAPLNCTVRESMLMGMPVIMYETVASNAINAQRENVIEAKMTDINDLANKMNEVIDDGEILIRIQRNGEEYAKIYFNNEEIVKQLVRNFDAVINNYYNGIEIPEDCVFQ